MYFGADEFYLKIYFYILFPTSIHVWDSNGSKTKPFLSNINFKKLCKGYFWDRKGNVCETVIEYLSVESTGKKKRSLQFTLATKMLRDVLVRQLGLPVFSFIQLLT